MTADQGAASGSNGWLDLDVRLRRLRRSDATMRRMNICLVLLLDVRMNDEGRVED